MDMGSGLLAISYKAMDSIGGVLLLIGGGLALGGGLYALATGRGLKWRGEEVEPGKARVIGLVAAGIGAALLVYGIMQLK